MLIYIYAMVGWALFSQQDPDHYGNVGQGMLTMFVMLTFSNLPASIEMGQKVSDWTILYFISDFVAR